MKRSVFAIVVLVVVSLTVPSFVFGQAAEEGQTKSVSAAESAVPEESTKANGEAAPVPEPTIENAEGVEDEAGVALETKEDDSEQPSDEPETTEHAYPGLREGRGPLIEKSGYIFDLTAEYEYRNIYIKSLSVNDTSAGEVLYGIQRARTHWLLSWKDKVKINVQVNLLDGVLWGDNGLYLGKDPFPNEGTISTARTPNNAGLVVALMDDEDPKNSNAYAYGLKKIDPVQVRRLWGEVSLMAFQLMIGRMPAFEGKGILTNDGDNDENRFGAPGKGDSVDRIQIGTKPIQLVKAIMAGDPDVADTRRDRGFFVGFAYDNLVTDMVQTLGDDGRQFAVSLFYKDPEYEWGGIPGDDLHAMFSYAYRYADDIELSVNVILMSFGFGIQNFRFDSQAAILTGKTREISDAQSSFRLDTDPVVQDVMSWGMYAVADYSVGPVTFTLEFDYASGDENPKHDSELSHFYWSEDSKVGLLLFPHVLAYETARSAAAATEFLEGVGTTSIPSSQIDTGGGLTNAIVVFPQITWDIIDDVFFRAGVLAAWADKPVVDPYETLHFWDGVSIEDDLVNFNGGKPGDYYGTELDFRFTAKLWDDHFQFDLEGAVLFPGDALKDINGDAVISGLVEGRFTFRY